jgi:RimJ/RimL family protein N-acetyltransferase
VTLQIRRLSADDLETYRDIRLDALRDSPDAFGMAYEEAETRSDDEFRDLLSRLAVFGAFIGGRQVGLVAFARLEGLKHQHRGEMVSMYVRPEGRGQGVGLALITAVLDHARHHVLQLHLGVGAYNLPAIRLYEKAGFVAYGTEPRALFVDGRFIDEHLMVRFLDEGTRKEEQSK